MVTFIDLPCWFRLLVDAPWLLQPLLALLVRS